jgi:hypothetical protein
MWSCNFPKAVMEPKPQFFVPFCMGTFCILMLDACTFNSTCKLWVSNNRETQNWKPSQMSGLFWVNCQWTMQV